MESEVETAKATVASLREELGLLQDIKGLRSTRAEEESRLAEAQSQARAALLAAQLTAEGLEQFRVLVGTAKAKRVPVDGALFDKLLTLVGSLGPHGITELDTMRGLLAKEGMSAADGAALLTGLWRMGFTLTRAADVARGLAAKEPFQDALNRLVSLLHRHGTLQAAVDAATKHLKELRNQEAAEGEASGEINRRLGHLRNVLADANRRVKQASEELERIRGEAQKAAAERETQRQGRAEEERRLATMREAWFDEFVDRCTLDDIVLLGARIKRKGSLAQAPAEARWFWNLMTLQGSLGSRPRLAADGTLIRGADGSEVQETIAVTLSLPERMRLRELLRQASLEGEGPLRALARLTSDGPEAPPKITTGSTDEDMDLLREWFLRNDAALELYRMLDSICDGKIGRFDVLPRGTSATSMT